MDSDMIHFHPVSLFREPDYRSLAIAFGSRMTRGRLSGFL